MLDWVLNMVLARNILTIDICKVIFCRLTILYTKYCPMRSLYESARNGFQDFQDSKFWLWTISGEWKCGVDVPQIKCCRYEILDKYKLAYVRLETEINIWADCNILLSTSSKILLLIEYDYSLCIRIWLFSVHLVNLNGNKTRNSEILLWSKVLQKNIVEYIFPFFKLKILNRLNNINSDQIHYQRCFIKKVFLKNSQNSQETSVSKSLF